MENPLYQIPQQRRSTNQTQTVLMMNDVQNSNETNFQFFQYKLRRIVESIWFRLIIAALLVTDIVIIIVTTVLEWKNPDRNFLALDVTTLVFSVVFMLDISLRIFAQGKEFFQKIWELIDLVTVVGGLIINIIFVVFDGLNNATVVKLLLVIRIFRIVNLVRTIRIWHQRQHFKIASRHLVGQNKKRTIGNGFDLDLCEITERIVAMSFPCKGTDAFFRNDIVDVAHYLNQYYPDRYRVYNLCSERKYDASYFQNRVFRFLIDDHNVPRLQDLIRMGDSVHEWFEQNEQNIIAVHCKGGKGRTGTMISVALLRTGVCETAEEALSLFAHRRTDLNVGKTFQGVETPSQMRYVNYYEKILRNHNNGMPPSRSLKLKSIVVTAIHAIGNGDGSDLIFTIGNYDGLLGRFQSTNENKNNDLTICSLEFQREQNRISITNISLPALKGDVKIMFFSTNKKVPKNYDDCAFYFWFNTAFIEDNKLVLTREELDNPHKPKTWQTFVETFSVTLDFEPVEQD